MLKLIISNINHWVINATLNFRYFVYTFKDDERGDITWPLIGMLILLLTVILVMALYENIAAWLAELWRWIFQIGEVPD